MSEKGREAVLGLAYNGVVTTKQVTGSGIHRGALGELVDNGLLVRCSRGIYMTADDWEDEFFLLQKKYGRGIFSHDSALYLLGYSERVPLSFHMTFPQKYHSASLADENVTVTRVIPANYELGVRTVLTMSGNEVICYDVERCLCDMVKGVGGDIQVTQYAMKKYASSRERNINKLMTYAKQLRVEPKIRRYMEVLL